jgi:hypothetical protein
VCSAGCLRSCTRIQYGQAVNFNASAQTKNGNFNSEVQTISPDTSVLNINFISFQYLIYAETLMYPTSAFISTLGGFLLLWVGLDFLFFIELLYWIIVIILRVAIMLIKKDVLTPQTEIIEVVPQQEILELQDV